MNDDTTSMRCSVLFAFCRIYPMFGCVPTGVPAAHGSMRASRRERPPSSPGSRTDLRGSRASGQLGPHLFERYRARYPQPDRHAAARYRGGVRRSSRLAASQRTRSRADRGDASASWLRRTTPNLSLGVSSRADGKVTRHPPAKPTRIYGVIRTRQPLRESRCNRRGLDAAARILAVARHRGNGFHIQGEPAPSSLGRDGGWSFFATS